MKNPKLAIADRYIITLRIIQPARVQDIERMYCEIWGVDGGDILYKVIRSVHDQMRSEGRIVSVRRGTYVLNRIGMDIAANLMKERDIDNARIFLMKRLRKSYH